MTDHASTDALDRRVAAWFRMGIDSPGEIWQREGLADRIEDVEDSIARQGLVDPREKTSQ